MLRAQYLLAILLGAALPTHAQNIVKDGDFEIAAPGAPDGSLVDYVAGRSFDSGFWTVTQGQSGIDTGDEYVYSGHKSLYLNDRVYQRGGRHRRGVADINDGGGAELRHLVLRECVRPE